MKNAPTITPSTLMSCRDLLHPKNANCHRHFAKFFVEVFGQGVKLYIPFYFATVITRRRPFNLTTLRQVVKQVIRGSLFFACSGPVTIYLSCGVRHILNRHSPLGYMIACFLGTYFGISVESKARHKELTVFASSLLAETLFRMGVSRGFLRNVPNGVPLVFAISVMILLYYYNYEEDCLGNSKSFLKLVVGERNEPQSFFSSSIDTTVLKLFGLTKDDLAGRISYVANGIFKGMGLGIILRLLSTVMTILTRKKIKNTTLFEKLRFSLFLASFFGGYRLTYILGEHYFANDSKIPMILASLVAGIASLISPSLELTMFICAKAGEALWNALVKKGYMKPFPGGEKILFSLSCAVVYYCSVFENHNVRPSYWKWLVKQSNYSLGQIKECSPYLAKELGLPLPPKTNNK